MAEPAAGGADWIPSRQMTSTTPAGAGLEDVDLADPDRFIDRVPFEMLALLRREDPVHWQEEPDGSGFWAVMKHADIRTVHKDYKTYSSERGGTSLQDLDPEQLEARKSMIDTDPPRHFKLRALINKTSPRTRSAATRRRSGS